MVALSLVEKELRDITEFKKKAKEPRKRYLSRLLKAVNDLPDDKWDDVSPEAQKWSNAGMKAVKAGKDIEDFPSDQQAAQPPETEKPETKVKSDEKQTKKEVKSKTDTKPVGIKVRIKEILLDDPKVSSTKIYDMLNEEGLQASRFTVTGIRSEFRHTIRVLVKRGLLKMDI